MTCNTRHILRIAALSLVVAAGASADVKHMVMVLTGTQEVPQTPSAGLGCGYVEIDTDTNQLRYRLVFNNLTSAELGAHIHGPAAPGVNAGILHNLPTGNVKSGTITYAEANEAAILGGQTYVNIHTTTFPNGEIRGQIVDMIAALDGNQATPPNPSAARGVGLFMLDKTNNALTYHIVSMGVVGEAAGGIYGAANYNQPGLLTETLPAGPVRSGTWTYADFEEADLEDGLFFVQIASADFPDGEIRGQIVPAVVPMDPGQAVPAASSFSTGCAFCSIDRDSNAVGYDVRINLIGSTESATTVNGFAGMGSNAPALTTLPAGPRKVGVWTFGGDTEEASILGDLAYLNVATSAFPAGELRGQILWGRDDAGTGCPADFNGDGFLDFFDYNDYVTCFESGTCPAGRDADFNDDSFVDFFDYSDYVTGFEAGC